MATRITRLITHSGWFHADDVCAYALLTGLYPNAEMIRTRDQAIIEAHPSTTLVFDVGRVYDASQERYDHHQTNGPTRDDGLAYAAFGLIWKHKGAQWLAECAQVRPQDIASVHAAMAEGFVRQIDTVDVGAIDSSFPMDTSLSGIIHTFNPASTDTNGAPRLSSPVHAEVAFRQAAAIARQALLHAAQNLARAAAAQAQVLNAATQAPHPAVLVLDQTMPWDSTVTLHPAMAGVLFVVEPSSSGDQWSINCARASMDAFVSRRLLPTAWRGRTDADLEQASGIIGARFCHAAGFCGGAATKDAALAMALKAVELFDQEDAHRTS